MILSTHDILTIFVNKNIFAAQNKTASWVTCQRIFLNSIQVIY